MECRGCRETETTIYHKGKAKERLSTERSGDVWVKNSRQGQLKWEQKWWMWFSQQATNLDSPSLLLQEKNLSLVYLIMETAAAPGSRQGFHIKALFPSAQSETDSGPFKSMDRKAWKNRRNKCRFQLAFIGTTTKGTNNSDFGFFFFYCYSVLKSI